MFQSAPPWNFDYRRIILDEVALEGLNGIGIQGLWSRLRVRLSLELPDKMKEQFWKVLTSYEGCVAFYELSQPAQEVRTLNRFANSDEKGNYVEPAEPLEGPYVYNPIPDQLGSSENYTDRKEISINEASSLSLSEAMSRWGDRLIVVAYEEVRWKAIAPHMDRSNWDRTRLLQYCLLELIGKSRENGVMTTGVSEISKIIKEPKHLFYIRKSLKNLRLITAKHLRHKVNDRVVSCILLRLVRFTKPKLLTLPSHGACQTLVARLKSLPEQTDSYASVQKFLNMDGKHLKKWLSRKDMEEFFKVTYGPSGKKSKFRSRVPLSVSLNEQSEESGGEDVGEDVERPDTKVECQYRVGVSLVRQTYARIVESGQRGMSLGDIEATVNVDIYAARGIVKYLLRCKSVKHSVEDKGKQRIGRYVATRALPDSKNDYAQAKEEFFEYLRDAAKIDKTTDKDNSFVIKNTDNELKPTDPGWNADEAITEIHQFEGLETQLPFSKAFDSNSCKLPSYRQLINANAIVKTIREKVVIYGTQDLNQSVHSITKLEQMDRKTLQRLLQRLMNDNLLRYYKIKWPGKSMQFSILICAPHITRNHPMVKSHFRDICLRAYRSVYTPKAVKMLKPNTENLNRDYYYPKYLRARKLHEFLFSMVYGEGSEDNKDFPNGCFNLVDVIPEMTVDLALGHISSKTIEIMELSTKKEILAMKIKEAPNEVCGILLSTNKLILTIKRNVRVLVSFGLIQMCSECCLASDGATQVNKSIYYVNRNTKILNTIGNWPRVDGPEADVIKYHFASLADVNEYWKNLYNICVNTIIDNVKNNSDRPSPVVSVCNPEEAASRDTGDVLPGDGLGAAGLDSLYFVHIGRYWNASCIKVTNLAGVKRKLADLQKFKPKIFPRKKPRLARSDTATAAKPKPKVKKEITKKVKQPTKITKVNVKVERSDQIRKHNRVMLSQWTPLEDKIIVWTRVAKSIMSPKSVPWSLQIANFVARDIITRLVKPKTAGICNNRANALERDPAVTNIKEKLLEELRRRPEVLNEYGGLCRKLRVKYVTQVNRYIQEGTLKMAELVWIIANLSTKRAYDQTYPPVAKDLDDLEQRFILKPSKPDKFLKICRGIEDVQKETIKEGILQTMNAFLGETPNMEKSLKIYEVFKDYPEGVLREGLDELRKQGFVIQPKGLAMKKLSPEEAVANASNYKLSVAYHRSWLNMYNSDFALKIAHTLKVMVPTDDVDCFAEMACILLELSAAGELEFVLTKKPSVKTLGGLCEPDIALADVDERVSVKLQRGKVGWRFKNDLVRRVIELYDDIALTNEVSCLCNKSLFTPPAVQDIPKSASEIVDFLEERKELGGTFQELLEISGMQSEVLQDSLKILEVKKVARKVGLTDNRVVLWGYADPWLIRLDQDRLFPAPWISMEKTLKQKPFMGWCGAVAQKIIDYPGCSIKKITDHCKYLSPKHVEEICTFLASYDCVQMKRLIVPEYSLFSDDDLCINISDTYEYVDPEHIVVFPVCDALVKYSLVKKKLMEYRP